MPGTCTRKESVLAAKECNKIISSDGLNLSEVLSTPPMFGYFLAQRIDLSDFYVKHNKGCIIGEDVSFRKSPLTPVLSCCRHGSNFFLDLPSACPPRYPIRLPKPCAGPALEQMRRTLPYLAVDSS